MKFYQRYPGDYGKKTARLSLAEHGAYALLMDEIYSTEEALPADLDELYRICRAMTEIEQKAVEKVAEKFFPIGADGLRHNERVDEEIAKAQPKIEAARENGKKGGRPPGSKNKTQEETQQKPSGFSKQNPDETHGESYPEPEPDSSLRSENTHLGDSTDVVRVSPTSAGLVCRSMKAFGIGDVNPGHLDLRTLIEAGATLDEFEGAAREATAKGKGFAYAVGIVKRRREEAARAPPLHQGTLPQESGRGPTAAQLAMAQACPSLVAPHLRQLVEQPRKASTTEITDYVNADTKLIA